MSLEFIICVCVCVSYRQKVTLWQHADELEHEHQAMGMWINSKTVTACMECSATFTLRIRKV